MVSADVARDEQGWATYDDNTIMLQLQQLRLF